MVTKFHKLFAKFHSLFAKFLNFTNSLLNFTDSSHRVGLLLTNACYLLYTDNVLKIHAWTIFCFNSLRPSDINKLTIIGQDNCLSPVRCQAVGWTNAGISLIGHLGTNFLEIFIEIHIFSFQKILIWNCCPEISGHFVLASMCWWIDYGDFCSSVVSYGKK